MKEALETIFNLILTNIVAPIEDALDSTGFCANLFSLIHSFLNGFFRLFNDNNVNVVDNVELLKYSIVDFLGLLVVIFAFYVVLKMIWVCCKSFYGLLGGK